MQLVLKPTFLLALLAGCNFSDIASNGKVDDTVGGSDTGNGGSDSGSASANALDDLSQDLDQTGCDDWEGNQIAGATSYYYGIYTKIDGGWSGTETWLLYANPTWQADGEDDCQLQWVTTATDADVSSTACGSCDVAMDVTLTLDVTETTCPEDMYGTEMSGTESYAIKYTSDTESTWYFAGDGSEFGVGEYNDGAMNFLTTKACKWF